jgi:hypothetical protein
VNANINNNTLSIKASLGMEKVQVFDISGKQILESSINNELNFNAPFNFPQAVYIVKVKLEDGNVAGFKLINTK